MWRWFERRRAHKQEIDAELQYHRDMLREEGLERGLSTTDAENAARRTLGNEALTAQTVRDVWSLPAIEAFWQDVRYAFRTMTANPAFSALASLSLALGIGANTAIFSLVDSILLRSLPVADPQSLVILSWHTNRPEGHGMNRHDDSFLGKGAGFGGSVFAYPALEMFRKNKAVFSSVFGFQGAGTLHFAVGNQAELAVSEFVSGNYFQSLGVPAAAGRLIMSDDDQSGAPAVVVISSALGERRFGAATNAVGQKVLINNLPFTVIGVAPPEFFGADPGMVADVYLPLHANLLLGNSRARASFSDPNYEWLITMARLRPAVTLAQAQATLAPQFAEWMRTVNTVRKRADLPALIVREGGAGLNGIRQEYSRPLFILLAVVGLILAIACANIANLLLARAASRRREIAVRLSIGAGRWRIVRQLLTESVMLAAVGGLLGVAFAVWGIRFLTLLIGNGRENFTLHAELNWHVLAMVAGLSIATGILFGLAPASQSTRVDVLPALKQPGAAARLHGFRRLTLARALIVAQIAISLVILVAAALFARTLAKLEAIDLGFNRENVLTFSLNAAQAGHASAELAPLYDKLQKRFTAIPGVRNASLSDMTLLGGRDFSGISVAGAKPKTSLILAVGPDFFTTMQIPLLAGREIEQSDMNLSSLGAVVNPAFVRDFLGGTNPIGQLLRAPSECPKCSFQILGICGNALVGRSVTDQREPVVFLPYTTWSPTWMTYELRTAGDPLGYVRTVREIVREADPRLPLSQIQTEKALIDGTMNKQVIFARLCTGFAFLALTIACVGLYGAMSYNVARRTCEIGIRMALGAARGRVVWMVLGEVLLLAAAGIAIRVPAALYGTKILNSFLYETKPNDTLSFIGSAACLVLAAALAGYLPARNASRVDPTAALRHE